jgi:uncharacterized protein (DUF2141 family)
MRKADLIRFIVFICTVGFLSSCDSSTEPTNDIKQGISGVVKSSDGGTTISNAEVWLTNVDSAEVLVDSTITSSNGTYKFENLKPGKYRVYCFHDEYYDDDHAVVTANTNTTVNFDLDPIPAVVPTVSFHVRDAATKAPIKGALVKLYGPWSGITDSLGNVNYDHNHFGDISFDISADGYITYRRDFDDLDPYPTVYDTIDLIKPKDFLVASYYFSNNFVDSTGHGHDATNHGTAWTADRFGNPSSAIYCDGTTDYVSVESTPALNFGKDDFTICVWVNTSAAQTSTSNSIVIDKSALVSGALMGYGMSYLQGSWAVTTVATTYGEVTINAVQPGNDSRWHLYTLVVNRKEQSISIYYDGELRSTPPGPYEDLAGNINTTAKLLFGGNGTTKNAFKGKIDDIKLFSVALDEKTIKAIYHENGW